MLLPYLKDNIVSSLPLEKQVFELVEPTCTEQALLRQKLLQSQPHTCLYLYSVKTQIFMRFIQDHAMLIHPCLTLQVGEKPS